MPVSSFPPNNLVLSLRTYEDHIFHLEIAFQLLLIEQFFFKLSKCLFAQTKVAYLDHVILAQGVEAVSAKVQAIL